MEGDCPIAECREQGRRRFFRENEIACATHDEFHHEPGENCVEDESSIRILWSFKQQKIRVHSASKAESALLGKTWTTVPCF